MSEEIDVDRIAKEIVAACIYQKFGELYFDDSNAEYFLDCLMYLSGDETFKERAIAHVGENVVKECLEVTDERNA